MTVKFERLELFVVTVETEHLDHNGDPRRHRQYVFIDPFTEQVILTHDCASPTATDHTGQKLAAMVGRP